MADVRSFQSLYEGEPWPDKSTPEPRRYLELIPEAPVQRLKRIVDVMGGTLIDGGRRALIRGPGHGPNDRSVSLLETEDGRILIHCFSPRDDWRLVRDELAKLGLLDKGADHDPRIQEPPKRPCLDAARSDRQARMLQIWDQAQPIAGTIGERYLRARAIEGELPGPQTLRFHPRMTSLEDRKRRPALVAALVDATGALQGIQVTLLTAHGLGKALVPTPRRTIGRLMGNYVPIDAPSETLIVAEGLETALSARRALAAGAWALLSAENLAQFEPPPAIDRLIIAADNDQAGLEAATRLHARVAPELACEVSLAPDGFADWNDWARAQVF